MGSNDRANGDGFFKRMLKKNSELLFYNFLLFSRLVDIVERRNEIIDCLENDRRRESEEDSCINNHITLYTQKREGDKSDHDKSSKEKHKEKKDKHHKKEKSKNKDKKKADSDKDVDESENSVKKDKKKKKKFTLF